MSSEKPGTGLVAFFGTSHCVMCILCAGRVTRMKYEAITMLVQWEYERSQCKETAELFFFMFEGLLSLFHVHCFPHARRFRDGGTVF